ncbi:MAG: lysostaphin resistance A-like protein [Candidatus Hodarchaeota archaeon]
MVIQERNETLFNFLTPALLIMVGLLILNIGAVGLILIHFFTPVLIPDVTMANIQINLAGQIAGTIATIFFFITLFRVKKVETHKPTIKRLVLVLGVCCFGLTIATFASLILVLVLNALGLPVIHSYAGIILGPEHLSNPWNLVLFFATGTVGAAIFEELIFRRMLIPALEVRGMSPTAAVITSSLGFALIHVPNDVLNGSFGFVITHFISAVIIGLVFGFVYVFTRNIIYPIIVHAFNNAFAFGEIILLTINETNLLLIYALAMLVVWFIAILIAVYAGIKYFSSDPPHWVKTLKQKSSTNILPGLAGYLLIAFGLVSFQTIVELFLTIPDIILLFTVLFLFYLGYLAILLWVVKTSHYITKEQPEVPTRKFYDRAEDVTQEPLPE